jgi:hypothetical protein
VRGFGARGANKYGAKRSQSPHFGARLFDSMAERDRAEELRLLEVAGEIAELVLQPVVELTAGIRWRLDFSYVERGRTCWEDVKGVMGRDTALKVKLWREYGPGLLRITKRDGRKRAFMVVREVMAKVGA